MDILYQSHFAGAPLRARFHRRSVKAPFSLFLALRYLKPKRTFVSIITLISVLGVTLGIAVLIIVIAVMTGFDQEFAAHDSRVRAASRGGQRPLAGRLARGDGENPGRPRRDRGSRLMPRVPCSPSMKATCSRRSFAASTWSRNKRIVDLKSSSSKAPREMDADTVLVGSALADQLEVRVGDKLTVYAPGNINGIMDELRREQNDPQAKSRTLAELKGEIVLPRELTVAGIFESGRNIYDANFMIVPLFVAQELYTLGDSVHGLSVQTTSPDRAEPLAGVLRAQLGPKMEVRTWWENNHDKLDAVRLERGVMFIILMFLIIIAAFGIMNTLIT